MIELILEYLSATIRKGADAFAIGFVGFVLGCLSSAYLLFQFRRHRDGGPRKDETIAELSEELERLKETSNNLEEENGFLIEDSRRLQRERDESFEAVGSMKDEVDKLSEQIQVIVDTDGRVWEVAAKPDAPRFVPRLERRATILTVANLKGGVGKTTVSANLGVTLASMGQEVLLIDLDHQHSLSDLCFTEQRRGDLKKSGRVIDRLFLSHDPATVDLHQCIERVGQRKLHCIASDENLADAETRTMARWLVGQAEDVRYLLRSCLHDQAISGQFDWIIIDCPPRLTTGSINALAASDYVLVPVILDAPSMNAVPRMVRWLYRLKHEASVCPQVSLLGVVANGTSQAPCLTPTERNSWVDLQGNTSPRWDDPIHYFDRFIPRKTAFGHAAGANRFAAEEKDLKSIFLDFATEVRKRVPIHERRESPEVPTHA